MYAWTSTAQTRTHSDDTPMNCFLCIYPIQAVLGSQTKCSLPCLRQRQGRVIYSCMIFVLGLTMEESYVSMGRTCQINTEKPGATSHLTLTALRRTCVSEANSALGRDETQNLRAERQQC